MPEYFGAVCSARRTVVLFPGERIRLLRVGGVPGARRNCVTPEQLRAPYIETETPQDQRKK